MNDFIDCINEFDFLYFCETWSNDLNVPELEGYCKPFFKHRKRKKSGRRDSGGLCFYVRKRFIQGVEEIFWDYEDGMLFKFDKNFFGWEKDAYVFCVYMRSDLSTRENINDGLGCYDRVAEKMMEIPEDSMLYAMGDWNGRIAAREECFIDNFEIETFGNEHIFEELSGMSNDQCFVEQDFISNDMSFKRINKDLKINDYGFKLLNLCSAANLAILNGRAFRDKHIGEYTYCSKQGKSTIDFILCNKCALYNVSDFIIYPFNSFSDHSVVSFHLKTNILEQHSIDKVGEGSFVKAKWEEGKKEEYIENLSSERVAKALENITGKLIETTDSQGVDSILEQFTEVLKGAGSSHIREIRIDNRGKRDSKGKGAKWYDKDCKVQKERFSEYQSRYFETGEECDRLLMCEHRSIYRNMCRLKKREYNQKEADRLVYLSKKEPRQFWREIKGDIKREVSRECDFFNHFQQLANIESRVGEEGVREVERGDNGTYEKGSEILDNQIEMQELDIAIKSLKKNKSSGEDNLVNEFFIHASLPVKFFIIILFNKILDLEYFPSVWAIGKVVPVFKKGDKNNANNYRGITIISCLGKLFTKIMNNRITKFVDEKNILSDVQYGFRKNRSTIDCLFIVKGLIDIMFAKGLKLYVCFIDYEKAYDLIDRACLFHKLMKEGISSKCINVFKNMYSKIKLKVATDVEKRVFHSNVGLLQGESTSPLLFSLFVNDLESSLQNDDFNLNVIDTLIKLLMFADDMAIFSTTVEGLQKGLINLAEYCKKWGITVNVSKTKIIIFRKGGKVREDEKWVFNGVLLEIVSSFKYVGCDITSTGSFKNCISNLVASARRALFSLRQNLNRNIETLPETQINLFNVMISPILNYGCEVWGWRAADPIEKFQLSFLNAYLK